MVENTSPNSLNLGCSVTLTSLVTNESYDITPMVHVAKMYENIFIPFNTCELLISDIGDILNRYFLQGLEAVTITFTDITRLEEPYQKLFQIILCEDVTYTSESIMFNRKVYKLYGVSLHKFIDSTKTVQKYYEETNTSSIVEDILTNYLLLPPDSLSIDTNTTQIKYTAPNLSPLNTINSLLKLSVSTEYTSSSYVCFENESGIHYKTVEQLIKEGRELLDTEEGQDQYTYTYTPTILDDNTESFFQSKILQNFKQDKKYNIISMWETGAIAHNSIEYDIVNKEPVEINYKLGDYVDSFYKLENDPIILKEYLQNVATSNKTYVMYNGYKDTEPYNTGLQEARSQKLAYFNMLQQNVFTCTVPAGTKIKAGDVLRVIIPEFASEILSTDKEEFRISGYFLVGDITREITELNTGNSKFNSILTLYKDSYNDAFATE